MTISFEAMELIGSSWFGVPRVDLNLSNENAGAVFSLVIPNNMKWGPTGFIKAEDRNTLYALRHNLVWVINLKKCRDPAIRLTRNEGNYTNVGLSDDDIVFRLERILYIVDYCLKHNKAFGWN